MIATQVRKIGRSLSTVAPEPLGVTLNTWPCGRIKVASTVGTTLKLWNVPSTWAASG